MSRYCLVFLSGRTPPPGEASCAANTTRWAKGNELQSSPWVGRYTWYLRAFARSTVRSVSSGAGAGYHMANALGDPPARGVPWQRKHGEGTGARQGRREQGRQGRHNPRWRGCWRKPRRRASGAGAIKSGCKPGHQGRRTSVGVAARLGRAFGVLLPAQAVTDDLHPALQRHQSSTRAEDAQGRWWRAIAADCWLVHVSEQYGTTHEQVKQPGRRLQGDE